MFLNEEAEERVEKYSANKKRKEKENHGDKSRAKAVADAGSSAMC